MTKLILDLLIFLSLGSIIYILVRALSRTTNEDNHKDIEVPKVLVFVEKADEQLKRFSEKFLRRLRLLTLKLDNLISSRIQSFRDRKDQKNVSSFDLDQDKDNQDS